MLAQTCVAYPIWNGIDGRDSFSLRQLAMAAARAGVPLIVTPRDWVIF